MNSILRIGGYYSRCSACGRNADPYEDSHLNVSMAGIGCGAKYVAVACEYRDFDNCCQNVAKMRPDLPFTEAISL